MRKDTTENTPEEEILYASLEEIAHLRKVFIDSVGMTPEEWLKKRHADEIEHPYSPDNTAIHYRALLLEIVEED